MARQIAGVTSGRVTTQTPVFTTGTGSGATLVAGGGVINVPVDIYANEQNEFFSVFGKPKPVTAADYVTKPVTVANYATNTAIEKVGHYNVIRFNRFGEKVTVLANFSADDRYSFAKFPVGTDATDFTEVDCKKTALAESFDTPRYITAMEDLDIDAGGEGFILVGKTGISSEETENLANTLVAIERFSPRAPWIFDFDAATIGNELHSTNVAFGTDYTWVMGPTNIRKPTTASGNAHRVFFKAVGNATLTEVTGAIAMYNADGALTAIKYNPSAAVFGTATKIQFHVKEYTSGGSEVPGNATTFASVTQLLSESDVARIFPKASRCVSVSVYVKPTHYTWGDIKVSTDADGMVTFDSGKLALVESYIGSLRSFETKGDGTTNLKLSDVINGVSKRIYVRATAIDTEWQADEMVNGIVTDADLANVGTGIIGGGKVLFGGKINSGIDMQTNAALWMKLASDSIGADVLIGRTAEESVAVAAAAAKSRSALAVIQVGDYRKSGVTRPAFVDPTSVAMYARYGTVNMPEVGAVVMLPMASIAIQNIARTETLADGIVVAPCGVYDGITDIIDMDIHMEEHLFASYSEQCINSVLWKKEGNGWCIWNHKTAVIDQTSPFSRIPQARIAFRVIEDCAAFLDNFLFSVSSGDRGLRTRDRIVDTINDYFKPLKVRGHLTDAIVICDESNGNTPSNRVQKKLFVDVGIIVPDYAEFIYFTLNAGNETVSIENLRIVR